MSETTTYRPTRIGVYAFTDATGVPLDGSIMVLDGPHIAHIYDKDGTELSNPVPLTNGHVDIYMKRVVTTNNAGTITSIVEDDGDAYVRDEDGVVIRTIPSIKMP